MPCSDEHIPDINRSHGCSKNCGETTVATPGATWGGREEAAEFIKKIQNLLKQSKADFDSG